jgi:hypothetical protein
MFLRYLLIFCFLVGIFNYSYSQKFNNHFVKFYLNPSEWNNILNLKIKSEQQKELIAVSLKWTTRKKIDPPTFTLNYSINEDNWSDDLVFSNETHIETDGTWGTLLPIYISKDAKEIKITPSQFTSEIELVVNIFTTVDSKNIETNSNKKLSNLTNCFCDTLVYKSREMWNAPDNSPTYRYADVTHLIVHHAAGTNTSNNWASVVLSIWDFHVNTNGFADIAYNWLIDPDGVLYEGRGGGNNVVGAHFCGKNTNTMGVCMLGNLSTAEPTEAALKTLRKILFFKSCDSKINPVAVGNHAGTVINNISGHKDGCATECPGNFMYPKLNELRSLVKASIDACLLTDIEEEYVNSSIVKSTLINETIELTDNVKWIKILDYNGNLHLYTSYIHEHKIDASGLSAGNYLIQVLNQRDQLIVNKIVKVK